MKMNQYDPSILDEIDQVIYISDMDTYELLFVNRLGREVIGCGTDYRGKKCFEVLQGLPSVCPFCKNDCLTENSGVCRWDHYNEKLGACYQLQDRQICFEGRRARIEIAVDISERESRQQELRNALAEQRMLTDCVRTLNSNDRLNERIDRVLANIGTYYQADRAYLFQITRDGQRVNNTYEWCASGITPQIRVLQEVDIHYIDRWSPAFLRKEAVVEPDIEHIRGAYPDEYQIMIRQGIHSYMEAPLFSEERFSGFLGVDNPDASMIGNSSAPILTMGYAISNAMSRDEARKREQTQYEQSLHEMTASVPGSVGVLRVNLSKDTCSTDPEEKNFFGFSEHQECWGRLMRRMSAQIPNEQERADFQHFDTPALLDAFRLGTRHVQHDYRYAGSDGKLHFVTTRLQMVQNPDTGEVEGVAYSLDQSRTVLQNEIFRIITDRSFDLVALIHLDSGLFEAVFLGDSIPEEYRALLPERGAECRFQDFCRESARHMDEETRKDYESRLSPDYIRAALKKGGGSYEFTLKESFAEKRHSVMYRKFLHYRLDSDPDTVLVIESDETEAVLHQQEELRRVKREAERDCLIMDSIMGGISVLRMDESGHLSVDYFNSYVFQMLGYESSGNPQRAEDAKGTPFEPLFADAMSLIHPNDRTYVSRMFSSNRDKNSFSLRPFRMYGNGGHCYWMLERVRTGVAADGGRVFYAAFHDVTEQIDLQATVTRQLKLEKQLRSKADTANAAKSDFLSRMSHDMRTPLNGIIGMTYLTEKMDLPPAARDNLGKIDTSSKFLLSLVNDILDMSKMENQTIELHPEPYPYEDFCTYLDAVVRPLCREKQQNFILDTNPLPGYTPLVDITRLNRIYFNLLSNAVKYTPEGGTITVEIRELLLPNERIRFTVTVRDNGIGMSREFQKHLFEPFVQESRDDNSEMRGSGLGLAIVKRTVEAMGGTICVKSEKGKGTEFTVALVSPCVRYAAVIKKEEPPADEYSCLLGKHVLLCEDHPLNQEIARALLTEKGMLVEIAEDGQKGATLFSQSPLHYFDCILMDLRMPVLDGIGAAQTIRAMTRPDARTVPILAMTADAFSDDIRRCLEAGMNGHIAKPIDPPLLYEALCHALGTEKGQPTGETHPAPGC